MSSDIKLISADDLITELLSRFDHSAFMGIQCRGGVNNDIYSVRRWGGNSFTVCGLCDSMKREILNDYDEREEAIGKDEI